MHHVGRAAFDDLVWRTRPGNATQANSDNKLLLATLAEAVELGGTGDANTSAEVLRLWLLQVSVGVISPSFQLRSK